MGNNFIKTFIETKYLTWWFGMVITLLWVTEVNLVVDVCSEDNYFKNNWLLISSFYLFNIHISTYLKEFLFEKQSDGWMISKFNPDRTYPSFIYTFYNGITGVIKNEGTLKMVKESYLKREITVFFIIIALTLFLEIVF